jgi:phytoene dehydrogenase-like protein
MHDAVIAGGGHNGLVAAAYLSRAGLRVLLLERLSELGGAAVSGSPFPGHADRLSRFSYLVSLFPERIARDLDISIELRDRRVAAYAEGRLFDRVPGIDIDRTLFESLLEPLPDERTARAAIADDALLDRPLGELLRERWDDPLVRGVIGTDGLIGTFASLDEPSLRQNRCYLWHVAGGPWRVPVGGMGALTGELARAARTGGAELRCGAEVVHVDHGADSSEVTWVEGGEQHTVATRFVLENRAPSDTTGAEGSQTKVNMLLDRLPRLRGGVAPEDAFAGTFRVNESEAELEAAYADAAAGHLPARPPAEIYCHSLTDRSIVEPGAPETRQTLTLFGLHTPARLFDADNDGARAAMTERYLDAIDEQLAEPIRDCLARDANGDPCVEAKTPLDLERELRLPRGNIFHGDLAWPWAESPDEVGTWGVETEHPRVFRCGAAARRGGGVSGVAGQNAAMAVLERANRPLEAHSPAR